MALVNNLTIETLASAMRAHLRLSPADAQEHARWIWDVELEQTVPQTLDDVEALIDALVSILVVDVSDASPLNGYIAQVRELLGEFMTRADADAAITQFRAPRGSDAQNVTRVRREWNTQHPVGARVIRWIWRIYWALAVVTVGLSLTLAIMSGNRENVIVAAILPLGVVAIVAGGMAGAFSSIRKEPSDPLDG